MLSLALSRMGLLLPLVLSMLATPCMLAYVPEQVLRPSLLAHGCNNSDVLAVAGFALQDLNSNRKDGYVLSLNRVNNVQEHRQDALGSVYYLTLDVLETDCHVLSKKDWRDCGERTLHESVYGQCKAIIYVNKPRRILYSPAYNCTLRPVSRRKIHRMCPDCPSSRSSPIDLSDPSVLEAATESLAKYNKESPLKLYSLVKVTRASSQWVFGPSYFVEYLIRELPCIKSPGTACILEIPNSPPVGICRGSLSKSGLEKFVSVSCNFFEPQGLMRIFSVQEPQQRNTAFAHSPSEVAPKGSVQHLPDLENEQSEDSKGKDPVEAFPVQLDLTTNPQGEPLDVSFLFLGPMKETLVVLPFPKEEQRSAECPGPAKMADPLVLPP